MGIPSAKNKILCFPKIFFGDKENSQIPF